MSRSVGSVPAPFIVPSAHHDSAHVKKGGDTQSDRIFSADLCESSEREESRFIRPDSSTVQGVQSGDSLGSIHHLPYELLGYVLVLSLTDLRSILWHSGIPRRVKELASVSMLWRDVTIGTAEMWTYVQAGMKPAEMSLALQRSRRGPLDLECDRYGRADMRRFVQVTVDADPDRWRPLRLDVKTVDSAIASCLSGKTSMLEAIHIRSERMSRINLGEGHALRTVEISRVALLPWQSKRFTGLRQIRIDSLKEDAPTTGEMIEMIAASPQLESLRLEYVQFTQDAGQEGVQANDRKNSTPIVLSKLTALLIKNIPTHAYGAIVSRLRLPACQSVILKPLPDAAIFDHSIPAFVQSFQHLLQDDELVRLEVEERHAWLRTHKMWSNRPRGIAAENGFYLRMKTVDGITPQSGEWPAWKHVAGVMKSTCTADVPMELRISLSAVRKWSPSVIDHFTNIQRLTMIKDHGAGGSEEIVRILEYMGQALQGGGWPWPLLKTIDLRGFQIPLDRIMRSVAGRWEMDEKWAEGSSDGDQHYKSVEVLRHCEQTLVWRPTGRA
ncbi:hypothetical protein FRB93_004699 [Tulasnella sp. JGI-2019a]|nr:hypothetical protein FRB93_004699 [Tulasnella sp. JGI-2019a]